MPSIQRPCIRKCCLDKEDICMGCFRSLEDMRIWHKATLEEKVKMQNIAAKRKEAHTLSHQ